MKSVLAKLGAHRWLAYPVTVVVIGVVVVAQMVVSGGIVSKLRSGWVEMKEGGTRVERLKTRLGVLKNVGEGEADEELKKLLLIVPATKQLLPIISGLRVAAARAGVNLEGYSAAGGEIKGGTGSQSLRVEANVAGSWPAVIQFVSETEKLLPMRRVVEASFTAGKARVVVEGRWAPLIKVADMGSNDVPDHRASLNEALVAVSGYEMPGVASESGAVEGGINPSLF